jgi:hypothetical protein
MDKNDIVLRTFGLDQIVLPSDLFQREEGWKSIDHSRSISVNIERWNKVIISVSRVKPAARDSIGSFHKQTIDSGPYL